MRRCGLCGDLQTILGTRNHDQRQQCLHALRLEDSLRGRKHRLHAGTALRTDRAKWIRQVDLHENPHRRTGAAEGHGGAPAQTGRAAPGSVRLRCLSRHRHRDHGQQAAVDGARRARPHLCQAGNDQRRRHAAGRARRHHWRRGRLYRRERRRRAARRPRHSRIPARTQNGRVAGRAKSARAAGPGTLRQAGGAATRRAYQLPRSRLDPLAAGCFDQLQRHADRHLARPALFELGHHAHRRH